MTASQFCSECKEAIISLSSKIESLDLNDAALNSRTSGETWTVGQILEHMLLAHKPYVATMQNGLATASTGNPDAGVAFTWFGRLIARGAGPEGNVPAPKQLQPSGGPHDSKTIADWIDMQRTVAQSIEAAAGRDLGSIRVRNPFIPLFSMNMADCIAILTAHTKRHVGQIAARIEA